MPLKMEMLELKVFSAGFFWKKSVVFKMDLDCPSFLSTKRSDAEEFSAETVRSGKEEGRRIRYA